MNQQQYEAKDSSSSPQQHPIQTGPNNQRPTNSQRDNLSHLELPDSHRSYNSLQTMSTTPENKAIDLAEELQKSNTFIENILDVLMTLQFEVIENRQLESSKLEKAMGELRKEIQSISHNMKNQSDFIKGQMDEYSSQVKILTEKENENSLRLAEILNVMKSMSEGQCRSS